MNKSTSHSLGETHQQGCLVKAKATIVDALPLQLGHRVPRISYIKRNQSLSVYFLVMPGDMITYLAQIVVQNNALVDRAFQTRERR